MAGPELLRQEGDFSVVRNVAAKRAVETNALVVFVNDGVVHTLFPGPAKDILRLQKKASRRRLQGK